MTSTHMSPQDYYKGTCHKSVIHDLNIHSSHAALHLCRQFSSGRIHVWTRIIFRPEPQAMSGRQVRDSTTRLRHYYAKLPTSRSRSRTRKRSSRIPMASHGDPAPVGSAATDPPPDPTVIPTGDSVAPGGAPGGGQPAPGGSAGDAPGGSNGGGNTLPTSPHTHMVDYGRRLKLLEEKLKHQEETRASRATSRASSRASDSDSGRRPSKRRSTSVASGRSKSRRQTPRPSPRARSPSRRRGYSPTSYRSHSYRRSPARSGRRRSRSPRRRTSSRSRSGRRRSARRNTRSRSKRRSRSASRPRRTRSPQPRPSRRDASPRSLRRDAATRDTASRALEAQYPAMGNPTGEYLHKSRATLEPYRNLPPDLKSRAGERRSRKDLSLPEHLCGLLSMAVKVTDPTSELHGLIEHAAQVAQDAVTIQWPTVRSWSQACLTHIQDSGASWCDAPLFKDERMRLSWCKGKAQPDVVIPCPAFNTATCPERAQHSAEGRTWIHSCAVCYYGISDTANSHTAQGCRKKPGLRLINDDGRSDARKRFNQNNYRRDDKPADRQKVKN